jgi:dodecin
LSNHEVGRSPAGGQVDEMWMAQVSEVSATSALSFEDAIRQGLARAGQPRGDVRRAWIKDQQLRVGAGSVPEYQVNLLVTFVTETLTVPLPEAGPGLVDPTGPPGAITGLGALDLERALSMTDEGGPVGAHPRG